MSARDPRAQWFICTECNGDGHHAKHIGAMTWDEFNERFDDEDSQAAYFAGDYDRRCDKCDGTGKVLVVPFDALTPEEQREKREYEAERASEARLRAMEAGWSYS